MSATIDQQFVEYIIKSIVGNPDDVSIARSVDEKGVLLELTVNQEDLGRVIGKRGATAQSVRTLLRALGTKNEARYNLKIVDNSPEGSRPPREDRPMREDSRAPADDSGTATATTNEPDEDSSSTDTASTKTDDFADLQDTEDRDTSSSVDRSRKELEDLDDLDIQF